MVDRTRLELVTSALRTPVEARGISLGGQHIADARPANVPISNAGASPHSSATPCETNGHKRGHIETFGSVLTKVARDRELRTLS
jgi:hypothetical protein